MEAGGLEAAPAFSLSTNDVPSGARASAVRDYLSDMMRVEVAAIDDEGPLEYSGNLRIAGGVSFGTAYASAVATTRTAAMLKDGQDELMLVMPQVAMLIQTPGQQDLAVAAGEAVLLSQAREMRILHLHAGSSWAMRVAHRDIARMAPHLGAAPLMVLGRQTPMLSMLGRYGRMLEREPLAGEQAQQMAGRHMLEMMSVAVGASPEARRDLVETSLGAVRLKGVQAEIAGRLGDTNLNLQRVAARQGVSVRHLQRLLAREGTSFGDLLRQARVARARALLEDPANRARTVLSIALECGFPEASALNRAFRQAYGLRPGDVR